LPGPEAVLVRCPGPLVSVRESPQQRERHSLHGARHGKAGAARRIGGVNLYAGRGSGIKWMKE
jgi:hypothetical protein